LGVLAFVPGEVFLYGLPNDPGDPALNTATGKVIGKLSARHRAVDFRDFLGDIDCQTEPGLAIHVICDNLFRSHQAARRRATSTRRRRPAAECPLPVPACAEQLAHP